jgi:hypothetical protein
MKAEKAADVVGTTVPTESRAVMLTLNVTPQKPTSTVADDDGVEDATPTELFAAEMMPAEDTTVTFANADTPSRLISALLPFTAVKLALTAEIR